MSVRNQTLPSKVPLRIGIIVLAIVLGVSVNAQEEQPRASKAARVQESNEQTEATRCNNAPNCVDAISYTATVTNIIESTTANSRMVRLVLRFQNVTDHAIILGYRAQSSFLLDNFKNRYFCSQAGQTGANAQDNSAVGIGIDRDNKVDPQLMLKPNQSDSASFDLSRKRAPDQQASFYDFDVMIDEIDPRDPVTVIRHPYLSFRNLHSKVPVRVDQMQMTAKRLDS